MPAVAVAGVPGAAPAAARSGSGSVGLTAAASRVLRQVVVAAAARPAATAALAPSLPATRSRRPVSRSCQLVIEAADSAAAPELPPRRISSRPRALDAAALPSRHSSSRLLALAVGTPALPAAIIFRTGQLASMRDVPCVLSSVAEISTSREVHLQAYIRFPVTLGTRLGNRLHTLMTTLLGTLMGTRMGGGWRTAPGYSRCCPATRPPC